MSRSRYFNKSREGPGTSFHSPAASQDHVRNVFHTAHQYLTKFHFDSAQNSKKIIVSVMLMMMAQILKSVHFTKTQNLDMSRTKHCFFFKQLRSICRKQLFHSLRANQRSSDEMKTLKDKSAQTTTTTRTVGVAYICV